MIVFRLLCLILFLIGDVYSVSAQSNSTLDSLAATYRDKYKLPGLAIAIIRPDTFYLGIDGYKRIEGEDLIHTDDPFHIGSNTKAFTAFLAAHLVEKGVVNWKDKLIELISTLKDQIHSDYEETSLEDLLSHRAGVAPFESESSKEFKALPKDLALDSNARLAFAKAALKLPKASLLEKSHLYSNGGYIIAALMFERASGIAYELLMEDLGKELGLQLSFGFPTSGMSLPILGHRKRIFGLLGGNKYRSIPPNTHFAVEGYFAPAGDLSISLKDFSHWIQDHLKGLLGGPSFLPTETYQWMHYGLPEYGMGWYNGLVGDGPERFSYHGGSLGTFSSAVMLCAERKIGIVILVNAESKAVQRMKNELRVDLWTRFGQSAK